MKSLQSTTLSHVPLLLPTVCLIAGILIGSRWHLPAAVTVGALIATVVTGWLLGQKPIAQTWIIHVGTFLLGMLVSPADKEALPEGVWMEGVVVSQPSEKPNSMAVDVTLPTYGETRRCYILKDTWSRELRLGEGIVIRLTEKPYLRNSDWQYGGDAPQQLSRLQRARLRCLVWREQLLHRYQALHADEEDYAVLAAMTLGRKDAVTRELRDVYSITGASHVLALSGLHLGIIYLLLTRLLVFRRRWLEPLVVVPALWAFAFLTGLSPSVVRAATMISIFAIFACRGQRHPSLNVLCFTAMVMLIVDARSLYDIGFQLSFATVFSILAFMPLLDRLPITKWLQRHRIVRWVWSLAAVSVTAQIGAAPLIAYYFGRFSTYFLLTNFIVIPAATLILYGALLTLLIPWPTIGQATMWIVGALNESLSFVARLPFASIEGLHPSAAQVVLIYTLFGVVYLMLRRLLVPPVWR